MHVLLFEQIVNLAIPIYFNYDKVKEISAVEVEHIQYINYFGITAAKLI